MSGTDDLEVEILDTSLKIYKYEVDKCIPICYFEKGKQLSTCFYI